MYADAVNTPGRPSPPPFHPATVPARVVLVDDAEDVRSVVRAQLHLSGLFTVVGQGSCGADAVALAEDLQPDLMVLDVSMPGMDGLEALPGIFAVAPNTRVVMLSGFANAPMLQAALRLGAAGFVDKGVPIRDLPGRLADILGLDKSAEQAPRAAPQAAEAVLAKHLERFRTFFDLAAIGMATMTLTGTIVRGNAALCRMIGLTEGELVGRPYVDIVPRGHVDAVAAAVASVGNNERDVVDIEHPIGDDESRWVHAAFAAVRDPDGRPLYLFAQSDDITERRKALYDLRESNERFRLLVENVRDYAIFMLDPSGHISSWNRGAERMKGYRAEEIIGQHFRVFYPRPAQEARHPEMELEVAIREGRYAEEGWRVRKDGSTFWASVVITAIHDHNGVLVGFGKVTRDVTERREANIRLQLAAEETAQFVAITAHELRSPIAAVTGAADILRGHWSALTPEDRDGTLATIAHAGERLKHLVDELLLASRLEAGSFSFELESMLLDDAVNHALSELPAAEAGQVEVQCPPGLWVRADRSRLVQILTNLLSNAAKHGQPPVRVHALQHGDLVHVRVSDQGDGVESSFVPRLFEKFAQAPGRSRRGTGLGLFIVRELARGQGGDAWYEPSPASGTFVFSLLSAAPSAG